MLKLSIVPFLTVVTPKGDLSSIVLSPSVVLKTDVPNSNGLADSSPLNLDLSGVSMTCGSDLTDLGTSNPSS